MANEFTPTGAHWRNQTEFQSERIRKESRQKSLRFNGKFFAWALMASCFNGVVYLSVKDNNDLPMSPFVLVMMLIICNVSILIAGMLKTKKKKERTDADKVLGGFAAAGWVILGYTLLVSAALFPFFIFFGTFAVVPLATVGGMVAGQSGWDTVWHSYASVVFYVGLAIAGLFSLNRLFFVIIRGHMTRPLKK